ncbi:MAG: SDR family NAD(P)-dependent oxidoreductase, partial [Hymenobacter sp.]
GWAAYCASKAALNSLSETAQKEQDLRGTGVRIWALAPGVVDTAMQAHIRTAEVAQFSEQAKFTHYYAQGQLQDAGVVAQRIVHWLHHPSAKEPVILRISDLLAP